MVRDLTLPRVFLLGHILLHISSFELLKSNQKSKP